jgi:hypothetical protein
VISPGAGRAALAENSAPYVVEDETTMTERSAVKCAWAEGVTYFAVAVVITAVVFQVLQGSARSSATSSTSPRRATSSPST